MSIVIIKELVNHTGFDNFITIVILIQAAVLVLETVSEFNDYTFLFNLVNGLVLSIFIIESILKIVSFYPNISQYFKDGWNVLDFSIIVLSLLPLSGGYTMIARLIRLLQIARLTHRSREMSAIVMTLVKSIQQDNHLLHTIDPKHWESLPSSALTLFQILTLEGFADIMSPAIDVSPFYGSFFMCFIVIGTFIVINIFVAVIVRKSEEAYKHIENNTIGLITQKEILLELKEIRKKIEDLESKIHQQRSHSKDGVNHFIR